MANSGRYSRNTLPIERHRLETLVIYAKVLETLDRLNRHMAERNSGYGMGWALDEETEATLVHEIASEGYIVEITCAGGRCWYTVHTEPSIERGWLR